jgi:hypothetical protein
MVKSSGEEVPRVALVLTMDKMEPDSAGGSLSLVKQPCGNSALWCLLTQQHEDGTRSEEAKSGTRRQLRRLDEQGRVERVKRMRENSEEEKVNMASML